MKIGAQLYTLRDYCKTLEDFSETLKKVADIGYTTVQVSGTCAYEPEWLAYELKKTGLSCAITHSSSVDMLNDPAGVVNRHRVFGCRYLGIGSAPYGIQKIDDFIRDYLPVAKAIRDCGGYMMYHNHQFEFAKYDEHTIYLDKIADSFPADCLGITLDTYWVQVGGGSSEEWLRKLKNRVPCIHLKDMTIVDGQQRMAAVGDGNLNFDRIVSAAESAGTEYLLVEQDLCYGKDPFDELKRSCDCLRSMGLE